VTNLRGDVAARARQQRHHLGQGFFPMIPARGYSPRGGGCCHGRLQSIPIDDGHSGTAASDRGSLRALAWLTLDPMTEVMVTSGGTEALTSAILAVVEPATRWWFSSRCMIPTAIIRQAGGIPRLVRLEPPHWRLTEKRCEAFFQPHTKAVLFNNPLNPAAVVYPREDLELLARFCQEFDTVCDLRPGLEHVIFRRPRTYSR